ncbi:diguanylate cyclase [uncultured Methylobacterium sp.]|uniref:GGDEF domain-containing protein n=1 Tax=uncultured Methylobacterium sp. TaxID=157278 RepID=UPI0035C993B2
MSGLTIEESRSANATPARSSETWSDAVLLDAAERVLRSGRYLDSFGPALEARFEDDTKRERVRQIRSTVLIGILVFNLYDLVGFVTVPDWAYLNLVLRALVVTPVGFLIMWASAWMKPGAREGLGAVALLGANCVPILLIALGNGPLVYLCTAEVMLSIVFANIVVPLRYSWACLVSATTALLAAAAVLTRVGIGPEVGAVIMLDLVVAMGFTLMATRRTEAANRCDYLLNLRETLRGKRLAEDNTVLARLSTTDPLTGLANRRRFTMRMDELWRSAEEGGDGERRQEFALILLDVDCFKRFNDRYGHSAGDDCLRTIAGILAVHATGRYDLAARYGGEEFAVLLPGRTLSEALEAAERIRLAVAGRTIPHAGRDDGIGLVTVSLGVAVSGAAGSANVLIELADLALYAAKAEGRNRTLPRILAVHPGGDAGGEPTSTAGNAIAVAAA